MVTGDRNACSLKRRNVQYVDVEGAGSSSKVRKVEFVDLDTEVHEDVSVDLNLYLGSRNAHISEARSKNPAFVNVDGALAQLLSIFPELCPEHAASKLAEVPLNVPKDQVLQSVIEYYLLHGVTRAKIDVGRASSEAEKFPDGSAQENPEGSYAADPFRLEKPPPQAGIPYFHWCLFRMSSDFPRVKMADLRQALRSHKGRLGPAYKGVWYACHSALRKEGKLPASKGPAPDKGEKSVIWLPREGLVLMKHPRARSKNSPGVLCPIFEKEWAAVQKTFAKLQDDDTEAAAKVLNEESSESSGQEIECGCCCSEFPFEEMVQCADGHLFCFGCLRRRVEESTFGGVQACGSLPCMDTNGCTESFPWSEVKRALPSDILSKYEQRQAEDAVVRAGLEGLVYCPFCNLPWEVDPGLLVLECPNETCKKASCIKCKEPSHLPLRCEEVEKKSETCLRKHIEEMMTRALIRECSACKAELVKNEGCNKVTCRCRQTMCYVCRKPIEANYKHFCQHVREPGKPCIKCDKCSLWEQEIEDDVIRAAREAALKEIEAKEPNFVKSSIGPSLQPTTHQLTQSPIEWPHPQFPLQFEFNQQNFAGDPAILQHEFLNHDWHAFPPVPVGHVFVPPGLPHLPMPDAILDVQDHNHAAMVARFDNMFNKP